MTVHVFLLSVVKACVRTFSREIGLLLCAVVLTFVLVATGFDWWYFLHTRSELLWSLLIPVAPLGFFTPLVVPPLLWGIGHYTRHSHLKSVAYLVAEAQLAAWLISSGLKGLTGRLHPEFELLSTTVDTSSVFHFGFLKEGIFWGWPSSHTAVAFAGAVIIQKLYPRTWWAHAATIYSWYIGIGVSATIHWFSDFVAGALVGTAVGRAAFHKIDKHR